MMSINIFGGRRFAAAVALLIVTCGTPSDGWCANLWIGFTSGGGIESFTEKQLKKSGSPTPIQLTSFGTATGLAFDKNHNLWVVADDDEVVEFTAAQLKNLKNDSAPVPVVIITSSSTFIDIIGCNFDRQGNLWVVDGDNDSIDELSKAQLAAGSGDITPSKVISSPDLDFPNFVAFDKAGNAWVDSEDNDKIAEFSASQLASSGSKSAAVVLSDDGSGSSLSAPGELVFDQNGNLWVPSFSSGTVVEFAKNQLTSSGSPAPIVKLSSAVFDGPWGADFDANGDLVVMNYSDGTIAKFKKKQLKATGAPVPKVTVTGSPIHNYQITFGPTH